MLQIHSAFALSRFQSTIEEVTFLCRVLSSPHATAHLLLLGHTHPEPLVQLTALHTGYTFTKPTQYFSSTLFTSPTPSSTPLPTYQPEDLLRDLVHFFTIAGVKNEKILLLLTEKELVDESFLSYIHQFVKGGVISAMFSKEERSRIVTAIRSDLAQSGAAFTPETAWNFFLRCISFIYH